MSRVAALIALTALGGCAATAEGPPRFATGIGADRDVTIPIRTFEDTQFSGVVRQRYDFSCGSAALATLLRYHYDYDVAEDLAFRGMWARGDQNAIRRVGFSLLDMKRWLASRGLVADGYKVPLDTVAKTGVPGIALITVKQYKHFVVVKGIRGDEVLLGDPSTGVTVMSRAEFQAAWNGIYFVLANDQPLARTRFNATTHWASYTRAPVGSRFTDAVSFDTLSMTAPYFGDL
jgi:hypothetical protein